MSSLFPGQSKPLCREKGARQAVQKEKTQYLEMFPACGQKLPAGGIINLHNFAQQNLLNFPISLPAERKAIDFL